MRQADIPALAKAYGFAKTYRLDASLAQDAPAGMKTLLLLIAPYDSWGRKIPGCPWISAYYFTAQEAYSKAREIADALSGMGEKARLCNEVRVKPLLSLLDDFSQGRNTLHYHWEYGSRFHVQVVGLAARCAADETSLRMEKAADMCGSCRKCQLACPAKAITEEGFLRDRCIRQHMLKGSPVPMEMRPLMEDRLLGCDICQQVCPYNAVLPEGGSAGEGFLLEHLLACDKQTLASLAEAIGRNMAIPNRVCAQACLAAGNSRDTAYLPALQTLAAHPSGTVAEHAAWAVRILTNGKDETTS